VELKDRDMSALQKDRMPQISDEQMTPAQKSAVREFLVARKTTEFEGPFVPLLRSPEILSRARNLGDYVRFNTSLPSRLSEFVILITAQYWRQEYEWFVHSGIAVRQGLASEKIAAVAAGNRPQKMADDEAVVYDFCMELLTEREVSDRNYDRLKLHFEEEGIVDTVGIIGYYSLLAMVMNTARTALPEGVEPAFS